MAASKMTQSQLIKKLAETVGVPSKVAKSFTTAYAEMAIAETKKNGVTVLPGIGRLVRVDRKARMGRNPATGESIKIPAKKVVKFRVSKAVKDAIVPPKKKYSKLALRTRQLRFKTPPGLAAAAGFRYENKGE